jgi:hypothetical protein
MKIYLPVTNKLSQGYYENATSIYKKLGMLGHGGYDFATPSNTPIPWHCDLEGKVSQIMTLPNSGLCLIIIVEEGEEHKRFGYAHLKKVCVKVGDMVKLGDLIAISDNTGAGSTGPHLHVDKCLCIHDAKDNYTILNSDNGYFGAIPIEFEKEFALEMVDTQTKIKFLLKSIIYRI